MASGEVLIVKNRSGQVQGVAGLPSLGADSEDWMDFRASTIQRPLLVLFCGLPGSGKTTLARERARETGAIRFSTDEWMADLGVDYFDAMRDNLQHRLDDLWKELLEHGQSVILEDGTWTREERDEIRRIAHVLGATTEMHYFDIPFDELWRRLELRNSAAIHGAALITKEVLEESRRRIDGPDAAELSLFDRVVVHS
ncbi:AAA family ATPase [Micromonospora sp. DT81.3]|uniref:AAA family ATPase n=1 Tax=Micromonospora sp. DT81.3 TaxID=3416523 RepID=UPI003CF11915